MGTSQALRRDGIGTRIVQGSPLVVYKTGLTVVKTVNLCISYASLHLSICGFIDR